MNYPEHEKMMAVKEDSQAIGVFLDALSNYGIYLCEEVPEEDRKYCERYMPTLKNVEQILSMYFDIDLQKISEEKQMMYEELININK